MTAIVLNYRRAADTLACICSLTASSVVPSHVMVVDNDSQDGSVETIAGSRPDVELVNSGGNLGYAGGMNAGLRKALEQDEEYILVMNSDAFVEKNTIASLVAALECSPAAGAATGTFYYYPDTDRIWYAGGTLAYGRAIAVTHRTHPAIGQKARAGGVAVTFLTGCAILFRSNALRRVGLFDERYFMYLEDVELSARMIHHGIPLVYVPEATFYHRLDVDEQTPLKTYFVMRNRLLFLETAPSWHLRALGTLFYAVMFTVKAVRWAFTDWPMLRAAVMGVQDYLHRRWYAGRGIPTGAGYHEQRRPNAYRD
jgi:GT2 family glycosyltransferase